MCIGIDQLTWSWSLHVFCSKDLFVHVVERYPTALCQGIRCRASDIDSTLRDPTAKYHIEQNKPHQCLSPSWVSAKPLEGFSQFLRNSGPRHLTATGRCLRVKDCQCLVGTCGILCNPFGSSAWDGGIQLLWFPCSFYQYKKPLYLIGFPK